MPGGDFMTTITRASTERRINVDPANSQFNSAIASGTDGSQFVVWHNLTEPDATTDIFTYRARHYDADGNSIGEFQIGAARTFVNSIPHVVRPSITGLPDNSFVVVSVFDGNAAAPNGLNGTQSWVYAQRFFADGSVGPQIEVAYLPPRTGTLSIVQDTAVADLPDGRYFVTWGVFGTMYGQLYSSTDQPIGGTKTVFAANDFGGDRAPDVVGLADNSFVAVWDANGTDNSDIFMRVYNADGSERGGIVPVNVSNLGVQELTRIEVLEGGKFVISWQSASPNDTGFDIRAQMFNADGSRFGGEFRVNSTLDANQYDATVTALTNGGFAVVWTSDGQDGSGQGIYAQRYSASGAKVGGEILVTATIDGDQSQPTTTALENGSFIVSWSQPDGAGMGIFSRTFAPPTTFTGTATSAQEIIEGTSSNEVILAAPGTLGFGDQIHGREGTDRITLTKAGMLDLVAPSAITGIEQLYGSSGDDTFVVSQARLAGFSVFNSGGGTDTFLTKGSLALAAGFQVAAIKAADASGTAGYKYEGNELGQSITGNKGMNTIYGHGGDDTLSGGDDLSIDTLYGGEGDDTFRVYSNSDRVRENVGEGFDRVLASRDFTLFPSAEIEMLTTSSSTGKDPIVLTGNAFKQTIIGNAGNNVLNSGGGGDTLRGLGGDDFYHVNNDDLVIETANGGNDTVNAHSNYVLAADAHVEVLQSNDPGGTFARDLTGNAFAQTIIGGAGANRLHDGGPGAADVLRGLGGDDTYVIYNAGAVIEETTGNDRVMAGVSYTLKAGVAIEMLTTTSGSGKGAINLTGNAFSQEIVGNAGDSLLSSGGVGGSDILRGLGGNDIYRIYNAGDVIVEEASQGSADRVMTSVSYTLGADVHVEMLTTNSSTATTAINLNGNALKQTITGNAGANILSDGGAGKADIMIGLGGNDTYRVYNSGDVIQETASQGSADRVMAAVDYKLGAGVYIESLTTNGSSGKSAIDLTGNEIAQEIIGNAGDNRLEGREGSDTLRGLGGKDTFVFNTNLGASNIDTILDFNVADDRFLLSDAIFTKLNTGVMLSGYFRANTSGLAQDANDHIIYETDTGKLFYDADGLGGSAGIQFAKIGIGLALTNADFSVA
jgi:Ca2+-binding RTX toxin-like protein